MGLDAQSAETAAGRTCGSQGLSSMKRSSLIFCAEAVILFRKSFSGYLLSFWKRFKLKVEAKGLS